MRSPAIEQEGLVRGLKVLPDAGVKVSFLVTDQHAGITKMKKEKYKHMKHWYNTWHVVQGNNMLNILEPNITFNASQSENFK